MANTNSALVAHTNISPNKNSPRNHEIDTITIHVVEGQVTAERLGETFANPNRQASANYGVDKDGRIGLYVEEKDRAWTSGSPSNDHRAITIEVASDAEPPYAVNDAAMSALIELLVDICKRNSIPALFWKGDKSLIGNVGEQNMTVHRWFQDTSCPGEYMMGKMAEIADKVNAKLGVLREEKQKLPNPGISVGDKVKIVSGATYTNGVKVPTKYIGKALTVSKKMDGQSLIEELYSWIIDSYLVKAEDSAAVPEEKGIEVGAKVKIASGAVYTNGVKVPSSVIGQTHTVMRYDSEKALLKEIYSWVERKYLTVV